MVRQVLTRQLMAAQELTVSPGNQRRPMPTRAAIRL